MNRILLLQTAALLLLCSCMWKNDKQTLSPKTQIEQKLLAAHEAEEDAAAE
ncbi:MAG: hypothetical protein ACK4E8_10155 [Lacibacter sp.]